MFRSACYRYGLEVVKHGMSYPKICNPIMKQIFRLQAEHRLNYPNNAHSTLKPIPQLDNHRINPFSIRIYERMHPN